MLQTLLQSYQNVSNSQLLLCQKNIFESCKRFCKVIKMLAIHNTAADIPSLHRVANAFAKLSKCQQFTTTLWLNIYLIKLQTLLQSYQNVSNSQLDRKEDDSDECCKRFCKVIKMLAIHNKEYQQIVEAIVANAFAKLSKCQQFTTQLQRPSNHHQLQTLLQSYQNVSNSQLFRRCSILPKGCKRFCKVIKMLAIHN